jgi:anti-sigma regulatory factor (Ser/Thr protein kinase)
MALGALPGAVPCARLHTREVLWEWALIGLSNDSELVVSELVTNAVAASRATGSSATVRLWLLSDGLRVLILVGDDSVQPPVRVDSGDDAESGRGLLLVEAVSTQWGWYFPDNGVAGKVIWALLGPDTQVAAA